MGGGFQEKPDIDIIDVKIFQFLWSCIVWLYLLEFAFLTRCYSKGDSRTRYCEKWKRYLAEICIIKHWRLAGSSHIWVFDLFAILKEAMKTSLPKRTIFCYREKRERGRQNKCKLKYRLKWRCKDKYNFKCKCKIKYRWRCKVQRQIQFQMQMQMLGGFRNRFLVRTCLEAMLYSCIVNCKTPMKASLPKERWLGSLVNL